MTDGQAMQIAKRMTALNDKIRKLGEQIVEQHPNGQEIQAAFWENAILNPADADDLLRDSLSSPDSWQKVGATWRHIGANHATK